MSREDSIRRGIDEYKARKKSITFDALTGHLDASEDYEIETMLRSILGRVYDDGAKSVGKILTWHE